MTLDPLLYNYFHKVSLPDDAPLSPVTVHFQHFYDSERYLSYPSVSSIGWERRIPSDNYYWDCSTRLDDTFAFQYTVSGEGVIVIDGEVHRLPAGKAFLIRIPSNCSYYLPSDSTHWEFKFLSLPCHSDVGKQLTLQVFELYPDSELLSLWDHIYKLTLSGVIRDFFQNSAYAYHFYIELIRYLNKTNLPEHYPVPIRKCIQFIEEKALLPIGLEDMANAAGISKFHLTRQFKQLTGDTPFHYLIKIRINKAAHLLVQTSLSVDEIAIKCGFANGNYFAKAFRRLLGESPTQFRSRKESQQIDIIRLH